MNEVFYLSQGRLYMSDGGDSKALSSEAVEKYQRNIREINKNKEWKTSGKGAAFMGVSVGEQSAAASVESVYVEDAENLIYTANLGDSCGIYIKNPHQPEEAERFILRRTDQRIYQMDYDPGQKLFVVSVADGALERHLALCERESPNLRLITEGESVDVAPTFSRFNPRIIYFSSAGLYYDHQKGTAQFSGYVLNKLDLDSGEITEILSDPQYDFLYPQQLTDGSLYCLRRPHKAAKGPRTSPKDILLVPVRVLKAIFGWLNFFSQRYTGESLTKRSSGPNPAQNQTKSEEEIFIEGNLINVHKSLKENQQGGEKHPGIAPPSWELIRVKADGSQESIQKGVLSYCFDNEQNLIYSNGKYILRRQADGAKEVVCAANVATGLKV